MMPAMRTTVTLDDDLVASLQQLARERGATFKDVLNAAVRTGLRPPTAQRHPYRMPTRPMGLRPGVDLDRALRLASDLEDSEAVGKLQLRK
jgi:hypothetical protein